MHNRRLGQGRRVGIATAVGAIALVPLATTAAAGPALPLVSGNLLVSLSTFTDAPNITAGTTQLPPNCGTSSAPNPTYPKATCVTAVAGGTYPYVFNNDTVDASFGVTEPIVLDQIPATTQAVSTPMSTLTVPNSDTTTGDQAVTSFPSKSEIALNQSLDGNAVTFMAYAAPAGAVDVSNSDTPGAIDGTNIDSANPQYRVIAKLNANGQFTFTETNAYSGNNGRAAILNPATNSLYLSGNAGNGSNPEPQGVVTGAGAQITPLATTPEAAQTPGAPTPVGAFNLTQTGAAADKSGKDTNFRGLTAYNGVLYLTKGSGGNGTNTVYYVDTSGNSDTNGKACPSNGTGLPAAGQSLPTTSVPMFNTTNTALGLTTANPGLSPTNMCILKGFPTLPAKSTSGVSYPFGVWFANPTTMYVSDEGSGGATYTGNTGGLQKWTRTGGTWTYQYTLQSGLNLGQPYAVANDAAGDAYPTGTNSISTQGGTGGNWAPATDGLRNLVGRVNPDGTATLWAVTSTVSGSGDTGADPNQLVAITDSVAATGATAPASENFTTVLPATDGTVYRGASFTPGTPLATPAPVAALPETPWVPLLPAAAAVAGIGSLAVRRRRIRTRTAVS